MWIAAGPAEFLGVKEEQKEETSLLRSVVLRLLADRIKAGLYWLFLVFDTTG